MMRKHAERGLNGNSALPAARPVTGETLCVIHMVETAAATPLHGGLALLLAAQPAYIASMQSREVLSMPVPRRVAARRPSRRSTP